MKCPTNKKFLIFFIAIALISSLSVPILVIFFKPTSKADDNSEKELTENLYEIFDGVYSKEEIDNMSKEEKEDLLKAPNQIDISDNSNSNNDKKELGETDIDNFYNQIISYSETADFTTAIDKIKQFKSEYNLNYGSKVKIDNIEYDITSIVSTITVDESQRGKILKNIKNPELMLIGTLLSTEKSRRDVITDNLSLSPIFDGKITILNITKLSASDTVDEKISYIKSNNDLAESVYKIDFQVESYKLTAYIMETSAKTLEFYGIYTPEGESNYFQTIDFWKSIDN